VAKFGGPVGHGRGASEIGVPARSARCGPKYMVLNPARSPSADMWL
jgi:hypothetical protein